MPCCGNARTQAQRAISSPPARTTPAARGTSSAEVTPATKAVRQPARPQAASVGSPRVYFKYLGPSGLTVTGPASSTVYRFVANGAPIAVDPRDAGSLARVPHLRMVGRI